MPFNDLQKKISTLFADQNSSVADYLACYRDFKLIKTSAPPYFRKIRTAFLGSFTLRGLPEVFSVKAVFHNLLAETYLAPYDQMAQEIMNPDSGLYAFKPDLVYLITDFSQKDKNSQLLSLIDKLLNSFAGHVTVFEDGHNHERLSIFNFEKWLEESGHQKNWQTKFKELGDFRLAPDAFPDLAEQLLRFAVVTAGNTRKCLVLDLDNTIWRGVIGEDGLQKIVPDKNLQQRAVNLGNRGIVLAINSKNNFEDAMGALEEHPEMVLRKNHFAAWRINWQNKDLNMRELADELNLGLDSFVFVDDDPLQQEMIRTIFPEVAVVPPPLLANYSGFASSRVTEEDIRRGQMYIEERRRKEFHSEFRNLDDFLAKLELEVTIKSVDESTLSRVSQLTQKTNQFNLATRRYSEDDIKRLKEEGWKIWALWVRDRFGDYGLTGVAIVEPMSNAWRLDNFLLSCRVLGRNAERALMAHILDQAKNEGIETMRGEYIPTAKNKPCETFLPDVNFKLVSRESRASVYEYDLSQGPEYPKFIKVTLV